MNIIPWKNKTLDKQGESLFDWPVTRFRDELDRMFDRFLGAGGPSADLLSTGAAWGPRLDLAESDAEFTLKAEMPGVAQADVDLRVEGQMLTIRGEKKQEKREKRGDFHVEERQYGSFQRMVQLPISADVNKIDAQFKDGVLTVTIAKKPDAKPRKVAVRNA